MVILCVCVCVCYHANYYISSLYSENTVIWAFDGAFNILCIVWILLKTLSPKVLMTFADHLSLLCYSATSWWDGQKRQWWLAKEHWTFLYYTTLAYPGIHIGGCLIVCMESAHKKILWSHPLLLTTPTQLRTSRHFEVYTIKNWTSTCLHGPRGYKVWWYVAIDELTGDYKAWQSPDNGLVQ